jgi:predicted nucleic acid-binding protein
VATDSPTRIAWDSNIVIDALEKEKSARYQWVKPLILDAEASKLIIVLSSVCIAETCRVDGKDMHLNNETVRDFFDRSYLELYAADRAICLVARDIRTKYDIDGADSIHLATAIVAGVSIFLTNDGDSVRQRNKKKNPTPVLPLDQKLTSASGVLRVLTPKLYEEMLKTTANPMFAKPEQK